MKKERRHTHTLLHTPNKHHTSPDHQGAIAQRYLPRATTLLTRVQFPLSTFFGFLVLNPAHATLTPTHTHTSHTHTHTHTHTLLHTPNKHHTSQDHQGAIAQRYLAQATTLLTRVQFPPSTFFWLFSLFGISQRDRLTMLLNAPLKQALREAS